MRLGRTTAVHFGSQVVLSLAGFVATFLIARLLGAETLGVYVTAVALLFVFNVPANAISDALNKRISEGSDRGSYLLAGVALNGVVGVGLALLVVALAARVDAYVGAPVSGFVATLIVGNVGLLTVAGALRGQKKVAHAGVLEAIERVGRTAGQVALILLGYGLVGLFVGHVASLATAAVLGVVLFEIRPSFPSRAELRGLVTFARYSWLGTLKTRAFGWMDTIVLAFFVAPALIGIYEVAWTLASTLALVGNSVQQTLFPEMSELGVEEDYDRIHHYLNEGLVFVGVFAIPGAFGAAILGPRVLRIYRPEFVQGATILLVLIVARLVAAYGSQFLGAINALDRPDVAFRINLVFVAVNVGLNVALVAAVGWFGAAIATALSATVALVLSYRALSNLIGAPEIPYGEIGREVLASGAMALVVLGLVAVAPPSHYVTVALVLFGALVYLATLLAISGRIRRKLRGLVPRSGLA